MLNNNLDYNDVEYFDNKLSEVNKLADEICSFVSDKKGRTVSLAACLALLDEKNGNEFNQKLSLVRNMMQEAMTDFERKNYDTYCNTLQKKKKNCRRG